MKNPVVYMYPDSKTPCSSPRPNPNPKYNSVSHPTPALNHYIPHQPSLALLHTPYIAAYSPGASNRNLP